MGGAAMRFAGRFIAVFAVVYVLFSLPSMLEANFVIDFVNGVSEFRKAITYAMEGLRYDFITKIVIAAIVSLIASIVWLRKKR
jgi:hypothetical protein